MTALYRWVAGRAGVGMVFALVLGLSGCPDHKASERSASMAEDASFRRRVFRPPPSDPVRAVPPHNIHRGGVGPYELSASLQETLALLPNGPRVELFEAKGLFDYRLMRSDGDALLIGVGRRGGVAFISVLDPDIARTEGGVGVGAGVKELVGDLGGILIPKNQGRDSRIVTFSALPETRFIVEKGKVVAAVVMPISKLAGESSQTGPGKSLPCSLKGLETGGRARQKLVQKISLGKGEGKVFAVKAGCLSGSKAGVLLRRGNFLQWATWDSSGSELKVQASGEVTGLRVLALLSTGAGHSEIYSISERRSSQLREIVLARHAVVGARLMATSSRVVFSLAAKTASWIGARLKIADFLVELQGRNGAVVVGGIYMERSSKGLRHVVPLTPIEIAVTRATKRAALLEPIRDAGLTDKSTKTDARSASRPPK